MKTPKERLLQLFFIWANEMPQECTALPQAGSDRRYFRIKGVEKQAIGVIGKEPEENAAFVGLTKHFRKKNLPVPELYAEDLEHQIYLIRDLGDTSLLDVLEKNRTDGNPDAATEALYRKVLAWLPQFQVVAHQGLDYGLCYPVPEFDASSMRWDLNYFKYYFLRLLQIPFDEYALEKDFEALTAFLLQADRNFFMYRDFQARNVMIAGDEPYFIDYQGGRKGPLAYDLASLLFQVKAGLPFAFREKMLKHYLQELRKYHPVDEARFVKEYYGFVLIRLLQVMGAYGFRGLYERKAHFVRSIPYAIENVGWYLENIQPEIPLPELFRALKAVADKPIEIPDLSTEGLTVSINSFSYKKAIPTDFSGNGGGFVFDCRALPNPGRYEHFRSLTGKDEPTITFLEKERSVDGFLQSIFNLVDSSVEEYLLRKFNHLQLNFGCTGGQHRSVYCAEQTAKHIRQHYPMVKVVLNHTEKEHWRK